MPSLRSTIPDHFLSRAGCFSRSLPSIQANGGFIMYSLSVVRSFLCAASFCALLGLLTVSVVIASASTAAAQSPPTFVLQWGSSGAGSGQFNEPEGVAVNASGEVYVADASNNRIQKFDNVGNFLLEWGGTGSGNGQFQRPTGVAVDAAGNVYVAENTGDRVQKFDGNGNYILQWASGFNRLSDVAVDGAGNVYVTDEEDNKVYKYNSNGAFIRMWGSAGTGDGQFNFPSGISTDSNGDVYVAERFGHRVQKFDSTGVFITKWGTTGTGDGEFADLSFVTVDQNDDVYVSDKLNHRIQKFDATGTFLTTWGTFGTADGEFNQTWGTAVDGNGDIFVADRGNNRIQKFQGASTSTSVGDPLPRQHAMLLSAHPNPFNPVTSIVYRLTEAGSVTLTVYDVRGRLVARLLENEHKDSGAHTTRFNASGRATGIYFVRLESVGVIRTHKIVLLK